jgi:hypothetical protein
MKYLTIKFALLFYLSFQSVVAAPDYVTSWPKKVDIAHPDPVLGNKLFWEYWTFSKDFASKFEGFNKKDADVDLNSNVKAIVLRIYKNNLWAHIKADYPKQYTCELDVYFDSSLDIPLIERKRKYKPVPYPDNIPISINRVKLRKSVSLENLITKSQIASISPKMFSMPVDGRYASFGIKRYFRNITPDISMIVLAQGIPGCQITAPLKTKGSHWLSLLGKLPFDNKKSHGGPPAIAQSYDSKYEKNRIDKSILNFTNGYFQLTNKFYQTALPKLTLTKVLNKCIYKEKVGKKSKKFIEKNKETLDEIRLRCDAIRESGIISDPFLYNSREQGLNEHGY